MDSRMMRLTRSEVQMMDIFWDSDAPLTSVDIVKMKVKDTWGNGLVHNIIRSLLGKGILVECGTIRYITQYARQFVPSMTREEYAAKILFNRGGSKPLSMTKLIDALMREAVDQKVDIEELEMVLGELKEKQKMQ